MEWEPNAILGNNGINKRSWQESLIKLRKTNNINSKNKLKRLKL